MTATAHAIVGGAIAASVSNPVLGVTLALISHPLLDMVPHWDAGWGWRNKTKLKLFSQGLFDLLLGFGLAYFLFGQYINFSYFFACVFASLIWDLAQTPYWLLNWRFPPFSWCYQFQHSIQGKAKLPWGVLTQVVTVGLIIVLLQTIRI